MQDNLSYGVIYRNRSNRLDNDRDSLTAPDARGGYTITPTTALQFVRQCQHQPSPSRCKGMTYPLSLIHI